MKKRTIVLFATFLLLGFWGDVMGQAVVPGDIIITEFMANPSGTDSDGEYVELYNKRSVSIDIDGFILKDDGTNSHTIDNEGVLNIPAEGFIVLAITETPGFTPDYVYSSFTLTNTSDQIVLTDSDGIEISRVNYTNDQVTDGASAELNALSNVDENGQIDPSNFQDSESAIGNGDSGSPGSSGSTNLDEDPTVRFSETGATVNETDGTINIEVLIEDPDGSSVDVDVAFQQNISTAQAGDFTTSTTQTVSFGAGATDGATQNASFTLDNDSDYEGTETAEFILTNISTSGAAAIDGQTEFSLTIVDGETPNVVINEFLADPGGNDVDGNGNAGSQSDDEFIEILNYGSVSVDISGWELSDDGSNVTHIFSEGTILHPSQVIVIFSNDSGEPDPVGLFGGSRVVVSNDGILSLNNTGDTPTLKDSEGNTIDSHNYSSSTSGVSAVRDPEGIGTFKDHDQVTGADGSYSPGTKTDGSLFTTDLVIEGNAGWRMLSAPVENMPISEIVDDTPIQGFGDAFDKNFYDGYDGTTFTAPGDTTGYQFTSGKGFILYFFNNTNAESSTLPVIIDVGSTDEPSSDVSVNVHADNDGWNLLGNPYQTAFAIDSLDVTGGDLASTVGQIWSDEEESYILTSANDDKVAPGQGFFIQNTDATSVAFPTDGKTTGTRFYKSTSIDQKAFVRLVLETNGVNGEEQRDLSTMLYFHDKANEGWDKWDVEKLYPLKASYSLLNIVSGGSDKAKAQDSRSFEGTDDEIFHLEVEAMNVGTQHTLEWDRSSNIPEEWTFTFIDNATGEEIPLDKNFSYRFTQNGIMKPKTVNAPSFSKTLTVEASENKPRFAIILNRGKSTGNEPGSIPKRLSLAQNYPNPFNPTTSIEYSVAEAGEVTLSIYNVMGQKVTDLVNETKSTGEYRVSWDASNMASGVYYYRLQAAGQVLTRKMTLIK